MICSDFQAEEVLVEGCRGFDDEMENILRIALLKLVMRFRRFCRGCRINWMKLILATCILTLTSAMLQACMIPYPLATWFLFPPVTVSSYRTLNGTIQVKESLPHQVKLEQFPPFLVDPFNSMNSAASLVPVSKVEERTGISHMGKPAHERGVAESINKEKVDDPKVLAQPPGAVSSLRGSSRSSRREKPIWSLTPDQALIYAKKEIGNAPLIADDTDLYAPIFRNVSVFKRSYELMERILKVYIYQDGARPVFHQPHLQGIYASEGWFMKLMEENRQFVVRDPNKAHLFYVPYSARQLQLALYVPGSHNLRPLSLFLKDYVNMIASKYPFWNRTRGSDHFLVACHDWGPYTTKEHDELFKNTIKALCNADISEGIFIPGKDVSLPETTIRNPKRPLRILGGKRVSQRWILAFFAGNNHGRVRPILRKHWDGKDEDMKIYGLLPKRVSINMSYIQHMQSSKFCICPMGYEVNSPRIVEAIYYECVPVIIADNFVPPFDEVLDWSAFSVIVAEKDIPNLKEILLAIPLRRYISMQTSVKRLQKHFLWHSKPIKYDIFHMILHSIWFNRLNQIQIQPQ